MIFKINFWPFIQSQKCKIKHIPVLRHYVHVTDGSEHFESGKMIMSTFDGRLEKLLSWSEQRQ